MRRVLIDTDPGIDDTAALAFLFGSGAVEVEALTVVWGNAPQDVCAKNALLVLDLLGRPDIPVYGGAAGPMLREDAGIGPLVHGEDGLGGQAEGRTPSRELTPGRAAEQIVERVMAAPGELDLIALGPLTNVATAILLEPAVASSVRSLLLMGGAVFVPGNVSPVASANLWNDPEAAAVVYRSGAPIVQVGLDVCRPSVVPAEARAKIAAAGHPVTDVISHATKRYDSVEGTPGGGIHYNDMPCVGYLIAPELYRTEFKYVAIETHGEHTAGQTVFDAFGIRFQEPNATVALEVDTDALIERFVTALTDGLAGTGS